MKTAIRKALDNDLNTFLQFVEKLTVFNRENHNIECKHDDYSIVQKSIRKKAEATFRSRNKNSVVFIAEINHKPVGYALGRIYEEDKNADNGTGKVGLFDELFIEETGRGFGIGQKLIDEVMNWMKEKRIDRVKLHAYSWNNNAKILYEKNGFKEYAVSYERFI